MWGGTLAETIDPYVGKLPFFLGEYSGATNGGESDTENAAFYKDMEDNKISNLAWDYSPYVDCAPDLMNPGSALTSLTTWGRL